MLIYSRIIPVKIIFMYTLKMIPYIIGTENKNKILIIFSLDFIFTNIIDIITSK